MSKTYEVTIAIDGTFKIQADGLKSAWRESKKLSASQVFRALEAGDPTVLAVKPKEVKDGVQK